MAKHRIPPKHTRAARRLAIALIVAAGLGAGAGWGHPTWWAPLALALFVALAESAVVSGSLRRAGVEFSFTDTALALAFSLAPGAWMVLAVVAGVVLSRVLSRQGLARGARDAGIHAASVGAGALVAWVTVRSGLPALSAGAVAMSAVWLVRSACAPLLEPRRMTAQRNLPAELSVSLVITGGSASVGLLAAWLALHAPAGLPVLLVPLALLWLSFAQIRRRSAEAALFAELARGQERAGGSLDGSAEVVLTAAARLLAANRVELLVFGAEGLVRYSCGSAGRVRHELVGLEAMDAAWVPRLLADGLVYERHQGVPGCGVRVGPSGQPLALLHAVRRPGAAGFDRDAVHTLRLLALQAESWLAVADLAARPAVVGPRREFGASGSQAIADLAADTGPALTLLQESAARLARLARAAPTLATGSRVAATGDGAVTEIVEELHTVERAVASLLGAIALANAATPAIQAAVGAEPVAVEAAGPEPGQEWTSSGVLA